MTDSDGFAIWFTGEPASGKSTLARALQASLAEQGVPTVIVDSDELRSVLTPNPTYSPEERDWFYDVVGYLAEWLAASCVNVLVAATGSQRSYRDRVRERIPRFAEVHVRCDERERRERDDKGIYRLADAGLIENVPGVDATYEPPLKPEAIIDTTELSPEAATQALLIQLREAGVLPPLEEGKAR